MKKPEPDVGVIGATTAAGSVSGAAGLGNGGVKINMTNQMTSLLPMRNTENVTDEIYPPVLVIGTKLDLLGPRSLRSLRRVNSRFNPISSYISNHYDNELSADNYPGVMMTPRSCISSVQFFEDTPSSSSASWNSLYHQNVYRNNNSQSSISSLPLSQPLLPPPTQRHQSVYVDLSDSQLSSLSSGDNKVWNFAAEQGFSEILLSCNSVASISPGSPQNVLLDRFFDEVINYKMFSMSMNCNLSPDVCRVKRRQVDSRDTSIVHNLLIIICNIFNQSMNQSFV
ncbi:unnamed protein product [Heterobilharzia americana]|nr:unnamed protein product [Heterobilharzia americana]